MRNTGTKASVKPSARVKNDAKTTQETMVSGRDEMSKITVRLPRSLHDRLLMHKVVSRKTVADLVQEAVEQYLDSK